MTQNCLVIGGSGLIGTQLIKHLAKDPNIKKIISLGRTSTLTDSEKITHIQTDFTTIEKLEPNIDIIFCTIGTTIKTARSKEKFKAVDYGIPKKIASLGSKIGVKKFIIVTSLGANKHSSMFYTQVKGELESYLKTLNFPELHILRPSILLGKRKEFRLGELISQWIFPLFSVFLLGKLTKYRAIRSEYVAQKMLELATVNSLSDPFLEIESIQGSMS